MDSRTQERVEQWDSRPFSGGYDGLSDLADSDFSGTVTTGGTWLFMLNGRVVGVFDGDIEDFENASGTVYEAPHPSLPLLCAMEERGGETRAKYYTNETPLREVDRTLQDGSFTGYVELSENVLSGDYYAVYYGGRRMAAAYIGNAERLLTGDEAFERADDEVGIYEVRDVEIEVTDVPGAEDAGPATDSASETGAADDASGATTGDAGAGPTADADGSAIDPAGSTRDAATANDDSSVSDAIGDVAADAGSLAPEPDGTDEQAGITAADEAAAEPESTAAGITDADVSADDAAGDEHEPDAALESVGDAVDADESRSVDPSLEEARSTTPADAERGADAGSTPTNDASSPAESSSAPDLAEVEAAAEQLDRKDISWVDDDSEEAAAGDAGSASADGDELEERLEQEEQWRETRSIPSIDPDHSETADSAGGDRTAGKRSAPESTSNDRARAGSGRNAQGTAQNGAGRGGDHERDAQPRQGSQASPDAAASGRPDREDRSERLARRVEKLEERRDALRSKAAELETERDRLRSENQELTATVERLQSRIDDLETELERARADAAGGDQHRAASTQLSRERALSGTNLFVRYASKSQPTLETAHDGAASRSEVASNLRLEHHTQFDATDVAVDGQPFEEFLTASMEYRFVDWFTEMVLYEIRDTGHADALGDLYDAIPRIDRAELHASISLEDDEIEEVPDQVEFDVVAYDKMGNPLVVANLNDSREPATQGMLEEMEEAASAVKANYPELAAAVVVTSSYFEPGALEVAEQATSGGFLSRGSKLSYVNLSRKQGYHLCLVESRSEGFHMNVPEL